MLLGCKQNCEQNPVYTAETRRLHSFLEAPTRESVYNAEHEGGKEKSAFQLKGLHSAARANVCMHFGAALHARKFKHYTEDYF